MAHQDGTGKAWLWRVIHGISTIFFGGVLLLHSGGGMVLAQPPGLAFSPGPAGYHPKSLASHLPHQPEQTMDWRQAGPNRSTGPIQVVGEASPAEAEQITQELQTTWQQMARLADRWTQAHRRPDFPGRSFLVVVGQGRMHFPQPITYRSPGRTPTAPSDRAVLSPAIWLLDQQPAMVLMAAGTDVRLVPGASGPAQQQTVRELQRQLVLGFLSRLSNGQQVPLWVQMGLAEYVAELPGSSTWSGSSAWPSRMPPLPPLDKDITWGQTPPEHREIPPAAYATCGQWIRYFLEGRDAQYAPAFMAALASANPRNQIENLLQHIRLASGPAGRWEPEFGQPVVRTVGEPAALGETERKLLFLLKLQWRFASGQSPRTTQPKILQQGQDRSVQMAWTAEKPAPNRLPELQQQIFDPRQPRWATLDWNGQLLFSEDQAVWQAFFQELHGRYQIVQQQHEEKTIFLLQHPEGGVLEGWLEPNPQQPGRPIACLKRSKA